MPDRIITVSRNRSTGNAISNYYSEFCYFDYKFDRLDIHLASATPPKGFHPRKEAPVLPLLSSGEVAPGWALSDANGKGLALTQLKGRVLLLEFFFIGCQHGMDAVKPLDDLYERYKDRHFALVGMSDHDSPRAMMEFKKNYNIGYPLFGDATFAFQSYHVKGSPTFYFIDKEGRVANVIEGYTDDLEKRAAAIIDGLLNK
jgi:peroxiredoxin